MKIYSAQKGNVLFIILIAVALFAALSYAVSNSFRGGESISKEQARILAGGILRRGADIEKAVQHVILNNGCSETEIEFWNSFYTAKDGSSIETASSNPNYSRAECNLYTPNGGGLSLAYVDSKALTNGSATPATYGKQGHWAAAMSVNVMNIGSTANDIAVTAPALTEDVCREINRQQGINTLYTGIAGGGNYHRWYAGGSNNIDQALTSVLGDAETELSGKKAFCVNTRTTASSEYPDSFWYIHVVYPR